MAALTLEIITPEKLVYLGQAEAVTLPGTEGQFSVLKGHAPLVSSLDIGELTATRGSTKMHFALNKGFVQVLHDRVTVLVETAESADVIDVERAKRAKERAEAALSQLARDNRDFAKAKAALIRSLTRLKVAEKSKEN